MKTILIASDHGGFILKERLKKHLINKGLRVKDLGTYSEESSDYPVSASALAGYISKKKYNRGVLICKTGIGNSIVANRFPGVRASLCYNVEAARLTREHNDSNVLVLGSLFVKPKEAQHILDVWLDTKFLGGRHRRRLNLLKETERKLGVTRV